MADAKDTHQAVMDKVRLNGRVLSVAKARHFQNQTTKGHRKPNDSMAI